MIKEFFKRNIPVFTIGLITLGIFVLIIVIAQKNPPAGPGLKEITNETFITDTTQTIGDPQSKVVLIEFSDFECPACKLAQPDVSALVAKYKGSMLFAFKNFPLPQHLQARAAAIAAQAAGNQGKFWEFADMLFANQPDFSQDNLVSYAASLQLDVTKFKTDIADPKVAQVVDDDTAQALRIGINGTPSFILDNTQVQFTSKDAFEKILQNEFLKNGIKISTETTQSTQAAGSSKVSLAEANSTGNPTSETNFDGAAIINYTPTGFNPSNISVTLGQTIRFVNKTNSNMKLKQVIALYSELTQPVTIGPGDYIELQITQNQLWTFKEADHMYYGSVTPVVQ